MTKVPVRVWLIFGLSLFVLSQAAVIVRLAKTPPEILGFWRMVMSTAIVFLMIRLSKKKPDLKFLVNNPIPVLISGVLFFLHFWIWFHGVMRSPVANVTLLFCLNPVFVSVLAVGFGKEKFSWPLRLALLSGILGLVVMEWDALSFGSDTLLGDLLALSAGVCFAGYVYTTKKMRTATDNLSMTLWFNVICLIGFGLVALGSDHSFTGQPTASWFWYFVMAIGPSILGHMLFSYSLKYLSASVASCFVLIEPIMAAFTASMVFGEKLSNSFLIAFLIVSAGLVNLFLRARAAKA